MTIFTDKVIKYNERLKKDFQINDIQACGIWGNLGTETGGFTALQEKNPTVKGSRGGYGWMQWTGPRRKKYESWVKEKGLDISSDETNYLYLVHETLTDEWKSIQQVRKTTTLETATETFCKLNLRPGVVNLTSRVGWARKAADALKSTGGTKPTPVTKTAVGASAGAVVGSAAIYNYWDHIMAYWPWAAGIGVALTTAYIIYLIRKNNV